MNRTKTVSPAEGLKLAKKAAGGGSELAKRLRITKAAVSQWRRVPVRHIRAIEKVTGVPREKLRADLYG